MLRGGKVHDHLNHLYGVEYQMIVTAPGHQLLDSFFSGSNAAFPAYCHKEDSTYNNRLVETLNDPSFLRK